nr:RHS repeat-associated core domain-containing protein [Planomonospora venezuelensis]
MTAVMLPSLVTLPALPATAAAQSAPQASAPPDTPDQLTGSANGLASLVDTAATTTSVKVADVKQDPRQREGALPIEERFADTSRVKAAWATPHGGQPVSLTSAPTASTKAQAFQPLGAQNIDPADEELVESRTPTLRAYAESLEEPYRFKYAFTICSNETMTEDCTASGTLAENVDFWKVPGGKLQWSKQYWWRVVATEVPSGSKVVSPKTSFTTGVRQPVIGSQLATRGVNGQEFHQMAGNYTTTATDLSVSAAGPPLSVVRSYNSMDPRTDGVFGAGWSTRWDMELVREVRGELVTALVTFPDGRRVRFAANGDGSYQPPSGMYATLAETADGWRLMDKSAVSYLFDAQGRVTKITDGRGRVQELTYGADGKLEKVTAEGGRSLTFTWNGAHVASVSSDPMDGAPVTWTYHYEGDRLTAACAPIAAPNCTRYAYGSGSQYRSLVEDTEPYGYWRLNETDGAWLANGFGPAGEAMYGGMVSYGETGALAGTPDTAVGLDGEMEPGGSIGLPENALARSGDQTSVELWFRAYAPGVLVSAGKDPRPESPLLYVGTNGRLYGSFKGSGSYMASSAAVNDSKWHHVVLTVAGDKQTLYLDGQQIGTLTQQADTARPYTVVGNGMITRGSAPGLPSGTGQQEFPFNGSVDEIAVYGKPLTAGEVSLHYVARTATPNKMTKITLPSGRVWMTTTYDPASERVVTHTDQHGGTWKIAQPQYDWATEKVTATVTDPKNNTLKYVYDAQRGYRLVSEIDQLGKTVKYDYDTGGFLTKVTDRNGNVTEQVNDARGNVTAVKTCRAANNCQTAYRSYHLNKDDEFDPRNDQVTVSRDARSSSATDNTYATTFDYNAHGELTKATTPATSDFPDGRSATTVYTDGTEPAVGGGTAPAGLVESQKDPRGEETAYRYTAAGDLAEQIAPSGLKTTFTHDALGRVTSRTEISAAHPDGVTTQFTYDGLGRLLTATAPGVKNEITDVVHTAQTRFTYDADGNKLTETVADLTGGDAERKVTYTYDTAGRVETVTDPEGGVSRTSWDATGARTSSTDPMGTVVTYAYTKRGELQSTTLKNWTGSPVAPQAAKDVVLESRAYDPGGRLAGQVDAMGRKTSYTYFTDNRVSQVIADDVRLNGSTTAADVVMEANTYDAAGNLTKQVTGGGKATTDYAYDAANRVTSTTFDPAALKRKTAFTYDAGGNVTKKELTGAGSSRVESTEYAYSPLGQVTRQTVENGDADLVSTWTYDERGLLVKQTDPRGNADGATAADFTTTMRYDALGRLVETVAPQVTIEENGSAADGTPAVRFGYDTAGLQTHATDAEGRTITSAFDKAGRLTSTTAPAYTPPGGQPVTPKTSIGYDAAGRQTSVTDPRGYVTTTEYDALGRPVRMTEPGPSGPGGVRVAEFDLLGEQLAVIDPTGARSEATYDDLGRTITRTVIERKPTTAALTTTLTYDTAGNLTQSVAPGSKTTKYAVNAAGQITAVTDPNNNTTTLAYDPFGRELKVTDALGNATEAEYDLAGRKIGAKDLDGTGAVVRSFGFGYDPAGNPTRTTSAEGHVTRREFDALGRMTSLIEPVSAEESITTTFGYDATGARTRLTDGRGHATWTTYNSLGLAESVIEPSTAAHPDTADRTWTQVYDAAGNNVSTLQPGGVRIDRTFDHLGQITKETGTGAAVETPERSYTYDAAGRPSAIGDYGLEYNDRGLLTKLTKATAQVATYNYDALGNPTQRVDPTGTANFTWDNGSRLKTATDPVTGRTFTYGYDNANRLTSQTSANPAGTQSFTYDTIDRPTSQTLTSSSGAELAKIVYGWDKDDNLTSKTTSGTAGAGSNSYGYDHAGRLTSWTGPDNKTVDYAWDDSGNRTKAGEKTFTYDERNRLTSGGGVDYTYSPRGTLATETTRGTTKNLVFDAFDRLITDGETSYGYDALGRMTSRTKGISQQRFTYSGLSNDISVIADGSGAIQARYGRDVAGGLLSMHEGGSPALAVMNDLHGDMVATFTGTALADSTAYDPFGQVTHTSGTKRSLGYQGEYTDPDTGKVNMHARWYQPGTGAFTSRDDWNLAPEPAVRANRYTYAHASPMSNSDPSGHDPECCSYEVRNKLVGASVANPPKPDTYDNGGEPDCIFGLCSPWTKSERREAQTCLENNVLAPQYCLMGERISRRVRDFVEAKEGAEDTRRSAIRHFLWQVFTTVLISEEFAREVGDAHEKHHANSPKESAEDQEVNAFARKYALKNKKKITSLISKNGFDYALNYMYGVSIGVLCAKGLFTEGCPREPRPGLNGFASRAIDGNPLGGVDLSSAKIRKIENQAKIDSDCMTGPCVGSYGGHYLAIQINGGRELSLHEFMVENGWVVEESSDAKKISKAEQEKLKKQAEIDYACMTGPCAGSYGGHVGITINLIS